MYYIVFDSCSMCLSANDPYCGWDMTTSSCKTAPSGQPEVHYFEQQLSGCPFVHHAGNDEILAYTLFIAQYWLVPGTNSR